MSEPGRIIAVGNLKGGTGKSTISLNLACAMTEAGQRAAVVDTDPQGTCMVWTSQETLPIEVLFVPIREMQDASKWIRQLSRHAQNYDRLIIDLPAVVSPAVAAAFMIADLILIPSAASGVDIEATQRTLRHVHVVRRERSYNPPTVIVIPTRVERGMFGTSKRVHALDELGEKVGPPLHFDHAHQDAFDAAKWIGAFASRSRGHKDIQAVRTTVEKALKGLETSGRA